jgi:hypothetical protein
MVRVLKIKVGSEEYDAIEKDFEITKEDWNEYRLLDGGKVRLKTSVAKILRIKILRILDKDGNPAYTADGDPFLLVRHRTEVAGSE